MARATRVSAVRPPPARTPTSTAPTSDARRAPHRLVRGPSAYGSGGLTLAGAERQRCAGSGHEGAAGQQPGEVEPAVGLLARESGVDPVRQVDGLAGLDLVDLVDLLDRGVVARAVVLAAVATVVGAV